MKETAMSERTAGAVSDLWRYPVKSMLGERMTELFFTERGAVGDRAWALRDLMNGRIASAKKYPRLLEFHASYEGESTGANLDRVRIEAPGGQMLYADDPDASEMISETLSHPMRLERTNPASHEKTGIDRTTVFADVPVNRLKPEWTPETMPDYFQLMAGSFFEIAPVLLLASGSVEYLRTLQGGSALIDQRRFRPNIYIKSGPEWSGFVEDAWLDGTLEVGATVRIDEMQPSLGCVTTTLAQDGLPNDPSVLRTTAQHHEGCLGVYGAVRSPGPVRVGDRVMLLT
jgi:hypothetical protein